MTTRGAAVRGEQRRSLINGMLASLDYSQSMFALPLDVVGTTCCEALREINFWSQGETLPPLHDWKCKAVEKRFVAVHWSTNGIKSRITVS